MLKRNLLVLCLAMSIGGTAVMKALLARPAARKRSVSFPEAAFGTLSLRDDEGRIRRFVPLWVVFWILAFVAVGVFVK